VNHLYPPKSFITRLYREMVNDTLLCFGAQLTQNASPQPGTLIPACFGAAAREYSAQRKMAGETPAGQGGHKQ